MIQQAQVEDVVKIAPLFDQYRQFYGRPADLAGATRFLHDRLSKNESVIFFIDHDVRALGFVQLYPSYSSLALERLWILNDLFVEPGARGSGLGRALVLRAMALARETKAKGLTLKTALENTRAQRLYQALGWRRDEKFISFDIASSR